MVRRKAWRPNLRLVVEDYKRRFRRPKRAELDHFRQLSELRAAIEAAASGRVGDVKHPHQRRLSLDNMAEGARSLLARIDILVSAKTFDALFDEVDRLRRTKQGLNEMYVYDTALRLSAFVRHLPEHVYLHAGARVGAAALDFDVEGRRFLLMRVLPPELQELEPYEVEDALCIYKDYLLGNVDETAIEGCAWNDEDDDE